MKIFMEIFYGIVTTTLVVLSSFTLAIFQFFATAIIKKAKDSHNRLSNLKRSKISERNCPILGLLKDAVANFNLSSVSNLYAQSPTKIK
jgi:hypothetical protein